MKILKKICTVILAFALTAGALPCNAASGNISDDVIFSLKSLDIIRGDEDGNLNLDSRLTRAEFAAVVIRLKQMQDYTVGKGRTDFSDVHDNDWFYDNVYWLCDTGVINGYNDGTFRPDEYVSFEEAVKVIVSILGYGYAAETLGGYPDGYLKIAYNSNLARGVRSGDEFCRSDAFILINNSLDVYMNDVDDSTDIQYSRETLRDIIMKSNSSDAMYKITGIVQANASASIVPGSFKNLKDDKIVVDGVVYKTDLANAADYIGKQVDCYVKTENDVKTIVSIRETKENNVAVIDGGDIIPSYSNTLEYWKDNTRKKLDVSSNAVLLKNMRIVPQWVMSDISVKNGSVTLIDNDGDEVYDIISVSEFETYLVSDVRTDVVYFRLKDNSQAKKLINFSENFSDTDFYVSDSEGNPLEPSKLEKDTAVSVFESDDGSYCKVIAGKLSFVGTLTSADDDSLYFDGGEYKKENGFDDECNLGDLYTVYLNFRGDVFMTEKPKDGESVLKYGYAAEFSYGTDIDSNPEVLMLEPGDFVEVEERSAVEDDDTVIRKLKGQNKAVTKMTFAQRVNVDGMKMNASQLTNYFNQGGRSNRLMLYKTNSKGEISYVETPEVCGKELKTRSEQRVYNAQEKLFGGMLVGAFGATEKTKVLVIPDYETQGEVQRDDYSAVVEINDDQAYTVNGYDTDDRDCADLITIITTMKYDASSAILDTDKMAVLEKAEPFLDEDGVEAVKLNFWSDGKKMSYTADEKMQNRVRALKSGDIFYYAVSPSSDKINKIIRIDNAVNPDRGIGQFGQPADSNPEALGQITCGVVTDAQYEQIIDISNRRKDCFTIDLGGETVTVRINSRNTPAVYRYNKRNDKIEVITTRDIVPGDGTVMVHIKNDTVRGMILVQ